MSDLERALVAADTELGNALTAIKTADLSDLLDAIGLVQNLRKSVATVGSDLEHRAGEVMGEKSVTVGGTEWVRSMPPKRGAWKSEDLLRAVLDSRRVDKDTGELLEESELEKVQHVWNLAGYQARIGALKDRGLDPNEFSEPSWDSARWRVAKAADRKGRGHVRKS